MTTSPLWANALDWQIHKMEAVFGSVAAVLTVLPSVATIKKQQQLINDQGERIEILEDRCLKWRRMDERLTQFDLETGTKMVRVVTPIAQATKVAGSCRSLNH